MATTPTKSTKAAEAAERARASKASASKAAEVTADEDEETSDDMPNLPEGMESDEYNDDEADEETYLPPLEEVNDPTDVSIEEEYEDANQIASSSDPIARVLKPAVKARHTESGTEIRPAREPRVMRTKEDVDQRAASRYGTHSGLVGHSVPIVDDYGPTNPQKGGMIGGAGGPGAVGRVKAEQDKTRAAKALMETLTDGTDAQRRLNKSQEQSEDSGRTAYKVVGGAIFTEKGKQAPGQKAMLTPEEAKRFNKLGRLAPWLED